MNSREQYELLKGVPGIVWKKSENYQNAYKLEPFTPPQEWLDMDKEEDDQV